MQSAGGLSFPQVHTHVSTWTLRRLRFVAEGCVVGRTTGCLPASSFSLKDEVVVYLGQLSLTQVSVLDKRLFHSLPWAHLAPAGVCAENLGAQPSLCLWLGIPQELLLAVLYCSQPPIRGRSHPTHLWTSFESQCLISSTQRAPANREQGN